MAGAQVGEQSEMLSQRQQRAALRPQVRRLDRVVFWPADRAQQSRVARPAEFQRRGRERMPGHIIRRAADQRLLDL